MDFANEYNQAKQTEPAKVLKQVKAPADPVQAYLNSLEKAREDWLKFNKALQAYKKAYWIAHKAKQIKKQPVKYSKFNPSDPGSFTFTCRQNRTHYCLDLNKTIRDMNEVALEYDKSLNALIKSVVFMDRVLQTEHTLEAVLATEKLKESWDQIYNSGNLNVNL